MAVRHAAGHAAMLPLQLCLSAISYYRISRWPTLPFTPFITLRPGGRASQFRPPVFNILLHYDYQDYSMGPDYLPPLVSTRLARHIAAQQAMISRHLMMDYWSNFICHGIPLPQRDAHPPQLVIWAEIWYINICHFAAFITWDWFSQRQQPPPASPAKCRSWASTPAKSATVIIIAAEYSLIYYWMISYIDIDNAAPLAEYWCLSSVSSLASVRYHGLLTTLHAFEMESIMHL